ncbi:SCO family protein [Sandaracinus amylolyticus]|nr:SCO family protein [Sandaracinus amylolyticus]
MSTRLAAAIALLPLLLGASSSIARAQTAPIRPEIPAGTVPDEIPGVGVDEQFERAVPMDAVLVDHEGRRVRLGDFFDGERPVVLTLVYHQCASFCDMALRAFADQLQQQPWTAGVEYDVVTLSIDPRDTQGDTLRDARARILGRYGRDEAQRGWHFLGGTEQEIRRVADAVGYRYHWDERTQQFAHPGAMVILQPSGAPSRYLYGLEIPFNDVRIGLAEASEGNHLATAERVIRATLLYCYRWDHSDGRYVLAAWRIMRGGGVLTVLILGGFLFTFWRRERRRGASKKTSTAAPSISDVATTTDASAAARPRES